MATVKLDPIKVAAQFLAAKSKSTTTVAAKPDSVGPINLHGKVMIQCSPANARPFVRGGVKLALAVQLTPAQTAAYKAALATGVPAALFEFNAAQLDFIQQHAQEIVALLPTVS